MSAQAAWAFLCGCGWHRLGTNQRGLPSHGQGVAFNSPGKARAKQPSADNPIWSFEEVIWKSLAGGPRKEAHHEQNPGRSGAHLRRVVALVIGPRAAAPIGAGCRSASPAAIQRDVERSTPTAGNVKAPVPASQPRQGPERRVPRRRIVAHPPAHFYYGTTDSTTPFGKEAG